MVHPRYGAEEGRLLLFVRCVRTVCLLHFRPHLRVSRRDARVVHRVILEIRVPCVASRISLHGLALALLSRLRMLTPKNKNKYHKNK